MGFFSWKTADTNESIANREAPHPNAGRTVYLLQPNGAPPIQEDDYVGYGVFGGVDAFAWLAEMNGLGTPGLRIEERRSFGARAYLDDVPLKYPLKFSFNKDAVYEDLPASTWDPYQGFFYNNPLIGTDDPSC